MASIKGLTKDPIKGMFTTVYEGMDAWGDEGDG